MKSIRQSAYMIFCSILFMTLIPAIAIAVSGSEKMLQATDALELVAAVSPDEQQAVITASGAHASEYNNVLIAVWSDIGDQDDLKWYGTSATQQGLTCTVSIADHRTEGIYFAHAYSFDESEPHFLGQTSFTISPTEATATFSQNEDQVKRGVFQLSITVERCPSGVQRIQAPTWSDANGQDDLVWYDVPNPAILQAASLEVSDGSEPEFLKIATDVDERTPWKIEIPCAASNRDAGDYISHVYITTNNGICTAPASARGTAKLGPAELEVHTKDNEQTFTVRAYGGDFARAETLLLPTWSGANGQDDLVWYSATRFGTEWEAEIAIVNHRAAGDYICDAYATLGSQQRFVKEARFAVTMPTAEATLTETGNGFYEIKTHDISSPSGVANVAVPSWTDAYGQDDIVWHESKSEGEGAWSCRIEAGDHDGQEGLYISHVYLTAKNGITITVGAFNTDIHCADYIYVTGNEGTGRRNVWIKNPSRMGAVQMPTWSDENLQDDIVWYDAIPISDERYMAQVDCGRLKHFGKVITHVYVGGNFVGMTTFTITESDLAAYRGVPTLSSIITNSTPGFGTFGIDYDLNSPNGQWLQSAIGGVVSGGKALSMLMVDLKTGSGVGYNSSQLIYSASSIKGPYVAAINKFYPNSVSGYVAGTMHETITVSSNEGYSSLRSQFGVGPMANMQSFVGAYDFPAGRNYVDINAKDLAKLWVGCYDYFYENTNYRSEWCRSLYTDPYLSFIHRALGSRFITHTKPGWIDSGGRYTARNDAGIVMAGDRPYVVAIVSTAYGRDGSLVNLVNAIDAVHTDMVGR